MVRATYEHDKVMQGLADLRNISEQPLYPTIYRKMGSRWQRKDKNDLSFAGGVYAYWFKGTADEIGKFRAYAMENPLVLQGKASGDTYHKIQIDFTEAWLDTATVDGAICLYVGKSTNIPNRITGHIKSKTYGRLTDDKEELINYGEPTEKPKKKSFKKPNTTSQLRIGLERILPHVKDLRPIIMHRVHLSYAALDGYENAVNRFFLEDLAVGKFCPLLNVDIER